MRMHNRPHQLTSISQNDAQAHCACNCWSYVKTGYASQAEIIEQYNFHAHPRRTVSQETAYGRTVSYPLSLRVFSPRATALPDCRGFAPRSPGPGPAEGIAP